MSWAVALPVVLMLGTGPTAPPRLYAHETVLDANGVIAPWYEAQNGQCDWRVRVAAETLKRYPWATDLDGVAPAPHYVFSGAWAIDPDGTIRIPPLSDWANGDLGQRAAYILLGLVDYYRYTGDPAAVAHITMTADHLLDHCLTPPDHPWPRFLVSAPTKGKPYGPADPTGFIQLDIVAEVGLGLVRAAMLTGEERWLRAAEHWADLLAERCDTRPGVAPWGRYANPEDVPWEDHMTGGVVFVLAFFDELSRAGYTGRDGALERAREAGRAYLRDVLLPRWTDDATWGRNYWDWADPVQAENVTEFAVRYLMEHPDEFPQWRTDCRNLLGLFLHRTSVDPASSGGVYAGAWAYPESSACCGRSLWYGPLELATAWAELGVRADDPWAREMARRQMILATYDCHETGRVEDNIDGGAIVAGDWFKIAHPMALRHVLGAMAWLPVELGAARESHILRSSGTVCAVEYDRGGVRYRTYDAPPGATEVLRLAFRPAEVLADGRRLAFRRSLAGPGFLAERLPAGDWLVTVRHDGAREVTVRGDDPQSRQTLDWTADVDGAETTLEFVGNQFRLVGEAGPEGGLADVYLDGERLLVPLDCWCPRPVTGALLSRSGLAGGQHALRIVARGAGNPRSRGRLVTLRALLSSDATPARSAPPPSGPTETQRVVFGYAGPRDYVDRDGHAWRPATEVVARGAFLTDAVADYWWASPRCHEVAGTADPELYRHGLHAPDFAAIFTVGPGTYHVRLKLAETRRGLASAPLQTIEINGTPVVEDLDVASTAGGLCRAVDLTFDGIEPSNGVIAVRVRATTGGEAILQAAEVGLGPGGGGGRPITGRPPRADGSGNLLANGGFEAGAPTALGRMGAAAHGAGWRVLFAGATQSYVWAESGYDIHPDWGLPAPRTGREALRTHTEGAGHTIVYQEAPIRPGVAYVATAWAQGVDLHGMGFGRTPGDTASLVVQEIGAGGEVLREHSGGAIADAGPYRELRCAFTASPAAVRARFLLNTAIGASYLEGHVTYDDCELRAVTP